MSAILGIPVPSGEQIIVAIELLFILMPFRIFQRWLISEARRERNKIIDHHVKSGHKDRFKTCTEGSCASIRTPEPQHQHLLGSLPEIEADLELPQ